MKPSLFWLAVAPLVSTACILGPSSSTSGSGSGGSGSTSSSSSSSGAPCDGKGACSACVECASKVQCAVELQACNESSECLGLDQCLAVCGTDLACKQQCYNGNPGGVAPYRAAESCLYCEQCPTDCAGFVVCQ